MLKSKVKTLIASTMCATVGISAVPANIIAANADVAKDPEVYKERFMGLWNKVNDPNNGYFKKFGTLKVPYHSIETLNVEAPDYGHETTSEAFSYYVWLNALYGKFTGDWSQFKSAWDSTEKFIIPNSQDQKGGQAGYDPSSAATFANEYTDITSYPTRLQKSKTVRDPLAAELKATYGNNLIYGTHWLLDVDNWYGFGNNGNPNDTTRPSYINTFQRGSSESVWKAVPQPSFEMFKSGGQYGFLDLFTKEDNTPSKQWRYTNAPDADARTIQATFWADKWATEQGKNVNTYVAKAAKLGDFLRYSMFDKYFQPIGVGSGNITNQEGKHYLLSWYYAWGGAVEENQGNWGWRIGSSHNHFGYQSPMAAWILSDQSKFNPKSPTAADDWAKSLDMQLEFYQWLQSAEGGIAGGATNSYTTEAGSYQSYSDDATFYGMKYDYAPVYRDPASNKWFGMQAWSMQRMADYYYQTGDKRAEQILDKWAAWVNENVDLTADGDFAVPGDLEWYGEPDTWTGEYTGNPNLHVEIVNKSQDVGVAGSLSNALMYYSAGCTKHKGAEDVASTNTALGLLDALWNKHQDDKGITADEVRGDYSHFFDQEVYIPNGWTGRMPNGDAIKNGIKFIDIRSKYKNDPDFAKVEQAYQAGQDPVFQYHRFWAQSDIAIALGTASILIENGEIAKGGDTLGDVNGDGTVDLKDYVALQAYLANSSKPINKANADMNGDSVITISDLTQLRDKLLA